MMLAQGPDHGGKGEFAPGDVLPREQADLQAFRAGLHVGAFAGGVNGTKQQQERAAGWGVRVGVPPLYALNPEP